MKKHKSLGNLRRSLSTLYLRLSGTSSLLTDKDFCKRHFKGPLSAEIADSIKHRWSALLKDSTLEIVPVQLAKFKHYPGLGISLEGTVDVLETGAEVRPHHYIRSIQADGPVAADGTLKPQDELLEVNGKKLYGLNHLEVVEILKTLPRHVRIVCARRIDQKAGVTAATGSDTDSLDIDQMDDDDLMTPRTATRQQHSVENEDNDAATATLPYRGVGGSGNASNSKSRSFDDFLNTGFWSNNPTIVELEKTPAGLGFSVLDYQDPLSADETVIIIRSLVPGGVAHRDGRLLPGDRLLFVNDTNLERASLEETVRCLKSAPRGRIVIGVAKPQPLASAVAERNASNAEYRQLAGRQPQSQYQMQLRKKGDQTDGDVIRNAEFSYLRFPMQELLDVEAEIDDEEDELALMRPARQVAFSGATTISYFGAVTPPPPQVPQPLQLQLPQSLERTLLLRPRPGDTLDLGLLVESVDSGVNGCIVRRVLEGGLAHADGSLRPGDFVTAVNSDSLRRVSTSEARERLRCAGALGRDLCIRYYPCVDVAKHLASLNSRQAKQASATEPHSRYEYAIVHSYSKEDPLSDLAPSPTMTNGNVQEEPVPFADEDEEVMAATAERREAEDSLPTQDEATAEHAVSEQTPPQTREKSLSLDGSPASANASSWSKPRIVRLRRDENRSLGVVIVGGKVNGHDLQQGVSGVFIKQVADAGPDRRDGVLRTGDRILAVCGQDLTHATHEEAVNLIRNAPSPVEFCVQSLLNPACPSDSESSGRRAAAVTPEPQIAEVPVWDSGSHDSPQVNQSAPNSTSASGEDEFGYPLVNPEKHLSIKHPGYQSVHLFAIEKTSRRNLGLALAGHRDPGQMCVFVCGIRPDGAAAADGRLKIGDELLEVNGQSLAGKSHSNAAPVIADCGTRLVKLVVGRRENPLELMAVKPLQPPHSLPCDVGAKLDQQASEGIPTVDQTISPESIEPQSQQEQLQSNGDALKAREAQEITATETLPSTELKSAQTSAGKYGVELTCTLIKGKQGLGFAIMEGNVDDKPGIYVKHITEKGPAAADGTLRTGDRLLRANEFSLAESAYEEALDRLRSMSGSVVITVARASPPVTEAAAAAATAPAKTKRKEVRIALPPEADDHDSRDVSAAEAPIANCQSQVDKQLAAVEQEKVLPAADMVKDAAESSGSAASPQNSNPATCQIVAGRETVVEIDKGSSSLGLSIVGGSDTTLNAIVIHEVYDTGAAWKDRRLWAGDQILSVDERDLSNVTHEEAKNILLQAAPRVRLRVWRDDKEITEDDLYDKLRVDLVRRQGIGLGFSIVARSNDEGVLVSDIIKGGVAESDKRLQPGDRILEINGKDMRKTPHAEVATILKSSQGKVSFLIGRLKHVGVVKSKRKAGGF